MNIQDTNLAKVKPNLLSLFRREIDTEKYFICKYYLECSSSLRDAAWDLAVGQSVGNPLVRNQWESDDLFNNYSCLILGDEKELSSVKTGIVDIAFPIINTNWKEDGVTQLLVQVMGGQLDIDRIKKCHLLDIVFPKTVESFFKGPKFGINGIRQYTKTYDKPLLGAIIKPKTGITPQVLLQITKELVEAGVNFIKEDEILSNPPGCSLEERVPLISEYLKGKNVVYAFCINADYPYVIERAKRVAELGGNAIHVNFWNGLGVYKTIRELDLPLFVHFQKSGDKILSNSSHNFHIDFKIVCKLAGLMGVDFMHAGMWGGYSNESENELSEILNVLHTYNVMPALSCGMHPGLVKAIEKRFGTNFMANCGGCIHGHPSGTFAGAWAMKQAINGETDKEEYKQAIKQWGKID